MSMPRHAAWSLKRSGWILWAQPPTAGCQPMCTGRAVRMKKERLSADWRSMSMGMNALKSRGTDARPGFMSMTAAALPVTAVSGADWRIMCCIAIMKNAMD